MTTHDLIPRLTDEFLETLADAAKTVGWQTDYVEVRDFVEEVYHLAGKSDLPDLDPFDFEDEGL